MMSVLEYANDVGVSTSHILNLCEKLNLSATNKDDMLSEDDIIMLDDEISLEDKEIEEEEEIEDYEMKKLNVLKDSTNDKMKPKVVSNKTKDDSKFKMQKKQMYKNKEKLKENKVEIKQDTILYKNGMTVKELGEALNVNPMEIIKKLFNLGVIVNINQSLDKDTAELIVLDYNKKLVKEETQDIVNFEELTIEDKEEDMVPRPPVVTIMGHVDHGKTSLLDVIRKTNVVSSEAGGITQKVGAYQVTINDKKITFIDTPGHAAFTKMRARGAEVTDIVVIIVSAVDGVKPQTVEAIDHAKAAKVPIIVAINKMDLKDANPDRVLQELTEYGLTPEEWGGDTLVNKISCVTKVGINELLENILLVAEMNELKANPNRYATGSVIEARLDKNVGSVISLLIQNGTLRIGDPIVVGNYYGKVRTLKDDKGVNITEAYPSSPVEITGLSDLPVAGDKFMAFATEKEAKKIAEERMLRHKEANTNRNGMTLDDLFSKVKMGEKAINIVLKTDVKGSEEAIKQSLEKIDIDGVRVNVIRSGVGTVTDSDILLADASHAIIYGFNIRPDSKTMEFAKEHNIDIRCHTIIYKIIEELEAAIKGMLSPEYEEKILGNALVRQVFKFSKVGLIAGSHVNEGIIKMGSKARLVRDGVIVYDGKIASLQREKDKAVEVKKGFDCGITLENYSDIKEGDIIESYELQEVKR